MSYHNRDGERLLLVEDNPADAFLIREYLVDQGGSEARIIQVGTLAEAVAALDSLQVSAALLDLRLPDGNGVECVTALLSKSPDLPIVVLTGIDDEELAIACLAAGAQDYLSKQEVRGPSLRRALGYAVARGREIAVRRGAAALQRRHSAIVEASSDAIISCTLEGIITSWNRGAEKIIGYSREEVIGRQVQEVLRPVDDAALEEQSQRVAGAPEAGEAEEIIRLRRDGTPIILSTVTCNLHDEHGRLVAVAAICRDITESKRRTDLFRRMLDEITGLANRLGLSDVARAHGVLRDVQNGATAETVLAQALAPFEAAFRGYLEANASLREANAKLSDEIAERQRIEAVLQHAQRLKAIGVLAAGVAHNFNNLLTAVLGGLDLVEPTLVDERLRRIISVAQRAAERGSHVARQLLTFAGKQRMRLEVVDASRQLREMANLLRQTLRADVTIELDIPDNLWPVEIDSNEFELAILNLGINAGDAMPSGGTLRLRASNETIRSERLDLDGDYLLVEVADTGTGIAPELISRVFEPFFTTKDFASGSGLGLSQVHGFARQSDGAADIESEPGKGTKVRLYLPMSRKALSWRAPERGDVANLQATATILIVEDDEDVAELASATLRNCGYQTRVVHRGRAAIDVLRNNGIDLVFSDVVMSGELNGFGVAETVRDRFPHIPVLLATGYSEVALEAKTRGLPVVPKPYRADDLRASIASMLAGRHGEAKGGRN